MHAIAAAAGPSFSFGNLHTWLVTIAAPLALILVGVGIVLRSGRGNLRKSMHVSAEALMGLFWIGAAASVVAIGAALVGFVGL